MVHYIPLLMGIGIPSFREFLQAPFQLLLFQWLLILGVSRLFGLFFQRMHQPAVIGEIIAGIFLGVSGLGALFPRFFELVFPASSFGGLEIISKTGLCIFMFILGMELDFAQLRSRLRTVSIISSTTILIPFLCGLVLAVFILPGFRLPHTQPEAFAVFCGVAMSITAFPVLARIVQARHLNHTPLGQLAMSCAAFADVIAWCLLALVIAYIRAGSLWSGFSTLLLSGFYLLLMFFAVKPWFNKLVIRFREAHYNQYHLLVLSFMILIISALLAEWIGIHLLFGSFIAGMMIPGKEKLHRALADRLEDVSVHLFLPVFFAFNGLRLQLHLLDSVSLWLQTLSIIVIAVASKGISAAWPAYRSGISRGDSIRMGILMNTRGLMEIVVLNIGYELGILSPTLFAMFLIMALVCTLMTNPMMDLCDRLIRR
ncbi:MAG TPA: cation:proton antiporter [Chitinophagaceae bacterium]|nr:cation:proton antiporter [Chitinophagaceae bacterium]